MRRTPEPTDDAVAEPDRRQRAGRWYDLVSLGVLVGVLAIQLTVFRDYGITWDERSHLEYGDYVASFYGSLLAGETPEVPDRWQRYPYGAGFDLLGHGARRLSPLPEHDTLHLLGAFVGWLGLLGTWRLGRLLGGPAVGLVALVLLSLCPVYFGHSFNNPKDPPFAVGMVWVLWATCRVLLALPTVPRRAWVVLALTGAGAVCVRPVGAVFLAYLALALAVWCWVLLRTLRTPGSAWVLARPLVGPAAIVALATWIASALAQPAALFAPLRQPLHNLQQLSDYRAFVAVQRFGGGEVWSTDVPWHYLPTLFALKLPLPFVLLAALGMALVVRGLLSPRRVADWPPRLARGVVLLAIVVPPAAAILRRSALYDGLRHFLFLLPPLAVLAGFGARWLARTLAQALPDSRPLRRVVPIVSGLLVATWALGQVDTMQRLHPHQYIFFNRLAGGLAGAAGRFETDYYGNAHREAVANLAQELWHREPERFVDSVYRLDGCLGRYAIRHYLPANFRLVTIDPSRRAHDDPDRLLEPTDFFLADRRLFCQELQSGDRVVATVEREGVVLVKLFDRRLGQDSERP